MYLSKSGIEVSCSNQENEIISHFKIPLKLKFFEGHFPDQPILPAFAIIDITHELALELKLIKKENFKITNAKFLAALTPESEIEIKTQKYPNSIDFTWFVKNKDSTLQKASELSFEI